jgi:S1-C subfamily serine protease
VQYTYDGELGKAEVNSPGIVVGDGLVIFSSAITPSSIPEQQMKEFKIIIPGDDETEIDAEFQGRDDRTSMSFVKAKPSTDESKNHKWSPLKFEDVAVDVGDPIYSVGLLPKDAGYKSYMMTSQVAALLRGPVPQVLVSGDGLATIGSPVFDAQGRAIGFVHYQSLTGVPSFTGGGRGGRGGRGGGAGFGSLSNAPKFYVPARDFLISISDPPTPGSPLKIPHLGVAQLSGVEKAKAEFLGIKGQPAVEIGDVIPGFPAEKGGLKALDIITKLNGQPLERGDEPDEAAQILTRKIQRMKPGQSVSLGVLREGKPIPDITLTLEERPRQPGQAKRFFAEDLGFTSREIVFIDTYQRRMPADSKGVVVDLIKPQSSAQSGKLEIDDLIVQLNQTPVDNVDQFKTIYEAFRKDHPHEAVVLEVRRGVSTQVVRIEPPQ